MGKVAIEVLPVLSLEEQSTRRLLERKVEKAFYEARFCLKQLKELKLYRSTHKTFKDYCLDRFGFSKSAVYYLIGSVEVVDNLQKSPQFVDKMPTAENQCRPLKSLEPEQQREAWGLALKKASGKVPSASIVKEVVNQIQGKNRERATETQNAQNENVCSTQSKIRFVPLENPTVGQRVRIASHHELFAQQFGIITQISQQRRVVVELDNQQRELIKIQDLEMQKIVEKNGTVTMPQEGLNYTPGLGNEWYVRVDAETWHKLDQYAKKVGTATLGGAIARLLENL